MSQGSTNQSVLLRGFISSGNSTSTPLGIGATFTGTAEEVLNFAAIGVFVFADQASATDGLIVEYSSDGTNWDDSDKYTIVASAGRFFNFPPEARYLRVRYTNGAVAQGAFRLQTTLHTSRIKPSSHRITATITDEEDTELVRAVLSGRKPDGTYGNAKLDADGQLVTVDNSSLATVKGFADGKVVLSALVTAPVRATVYIEQTSNAQRSVLSTSVLDTSAGTGARTVRLKSVALSAGVITGPFTETITLNGITAVNTVATDICFIEDIEVLTVGSLGSNQGIITLMSAAGGAGVAVWSIAVGDNKTFGSHHYVINANTARVTGFVGGTKGADAASFFIRSIDPTNANAAEVQISDLIRSPSDGQQFRFYGTPVEVAGPARLTAYVQTDTASTRTYFSSFDFYE